MTAAGTEVITERYDLVVALQEVELRRKPAMIYVQAFWVGRAAGWPLGDTVITEKYYSLAMVPGGESGHT